MAYSAHSAGNLEAAIVLLRESTRILATAGDQRLYALNLSGLAKFELEAGFYNDALRDFDTSAGLFKQLKKTVSDPSRREAELLHAEAEIATGKPQLALDSMQQLTGMDFPYRKLEKVKRANLLTVSGDAFFVLHNNSEALAAYNEVIRQTAETIEQSKKQPGGCDRTENIQLGIEAAWRGLTAVELRLGKPEQAVADWEAFRGGRHGNSSRAPIHTAKGSSLLVYAFLPGRQLSGWLINHDGVRAQHMLDRNEALRLAAEFSALAANRETPPESIRKSARALNDLLIAPFAKDLPADNSLLVIDADGPLSSIPWAALEDSNGHALIERYSLSQTAAWAEANVADKDMQISKALIVSEPALGKSLQEQYPSLPEVQRETDEVRKRLPGAVFLQGASATLEGIEENASGSTLFHFSGHGISYGGFGAIILAPSAGDSIPARFITANEISRLPLHGLRMAVLAACSSGTGEQYGVVNLDSLVRGFLDAGAPRVVAARWDVNDEITSHLMINFYTAILKGERPAAALRQASLQVRKSKSHPYYWASFQVFGTP
jgi:CHAT domain-containing protein